MITANTCPPFPQFCSMLNPLQDDCFASPYLSPLTTYPQVAEFINEDLH